MTNKLTVTSNQTPIEVALQIDSEGRTTAKKLYAFLGLNPAHYARWAKNNISNNQFAIKNVDFEPFTINGECGGQATKDYKLSSEFAKKLAMASNSPRGEEARDYFIKVENKLKESLTAIQPASSLQALKNVVEIMIDQEQKITNLQNDMHYVKQHIEHNVVMEQIGIEETKELTIKRSNRDILALETGSKPVVYSTTDVARVFGIKSSKALNPYLVKHGVLEIFSSRGGHTIAERYKDKMYTYEKITGTKEKICILWWTEKGAQFVIDFLIAKGMEIKNPLERKPSRSKKK